MDKELGERLDRIDAQLAGTIGIVATLVDGLPLAIRELLLPRLQSQLEQMHATLLANSGQHSDAAIAGLESLRNAMRFDS